MKLYHHPISPFSRKVLFALYEKQLSFETIHVKPDDWTRQAQAMNNVFELGMTPVLVTDAGEVLSESSIIIEHLDLMHPGVRFVPSEAQFALSVRMFDRMIDSYLIAPAGHMRFERQKPPAAQSTTKLAAWQARVRSTLSYLERQLDAGEFLHGDIPLLSDLGGCAAVAILDALGFQLSEFPRVRAWYSSLLRRPAWTRILADTELTGYRI